MATILFTWEMGAGTGHITPYLELVSHLESQGHEIHWALQELDNVRRLFQDTNVKWHHAPVTSRSGIDMILPSNSYPKILNNNGYDRPDRLAGFITGWKNLYALISPDLLIFDYSPTAMLAAKGLPVKSIAVGTGFHLPPSTYPISGLGHEVGWDQDQEDLRITEDKVLAVINEALELLGMKTLSGFSELFECNAKVLRTFKEMDHYDDRDDAIYAGILKAPPGDIPVWPTTPGPKIFAYLKHFKTMPEFLKKLNEKKYPTLLFGDKLPKNIEEDFASESMHFVHKPLDMTTIGKTADVAICNANHGTSTELLLSGVPMLLLPLNYEQYMVTYNVARMGAGLGAPMLDPDSMEKKLEHIIKTDSFRTSAQHFAEKYRGYNSKDMINTMLEKINALLP